MAFETFNLGQVLQTAEGIKQMRRQSTVDSLREQYLGEQIQGMRADRERQANIDAMTFGKERATKEYARAGYILQAQNPKNLIESEFPDIQQAVVKAGQDWATVSDDQLRETARKIQMKAGAEAGIAPIESQQVGGATVITQGGQYKNAVTPRSATDNTPMSYREQQLAKQDPEYAQFLRERRGQGLSVTLPDGTTISDGGAQPFALPKTTQNQLGEDYKNALAGMSRLQGIVASVKPEYLTYAGQLKGAWQGLKAKAGANLSPQEREYMQGYHTWRSNTLDNLNLYIKEITGAAMAIPEAERIKATIPNTDDDPVTFQTKLESTMKRLSLVGARSAYLLANPAVSLGDVSLDRMQMIITDRANALYTGYLQQGMDERQARQQAAIEAAQQFGLSNGATN